MAKKRKMMTAEDHEKREKAGIKAAKGTAEYKALKKSLSGYDAFLKTSRSLGKDHGITKPEAKPKSKPKSRAKSKRRGDVNATAREAAAMRKQAERFAASRAERQKKAIAEKLARKKLKTAVEQVIYLANQKDNSALDHNIAQVYKLLGPKNKKVADEFNHKMKALVLANQREEGAKERKGHEEKARGVMTRFLANSATAIAAVASGGAALAAREGMTQAARAVGVRAARAGYRASTPQHGPPHPFPGRLPKDVKPPRTGRMPKTGRDKEAEFLVEKYGPPKGPAKAPKSRRVEGGKALERRAKDEPAVTPEVMRPLSKTKQRKKRDREPIDAEIVHPPAQVTAGGKHRLPKSEVRYSGPGTRAKTKKLPEHKVTVGEKIARKRGRGESWKSISDELGIPISTARSKYRRFEGKHVSMKKKLKLRDEPTPKLADFLRNRGISSRKQLSEELKRLLSELKDLGMPQRARELKSLL